MTIRLGEPFWRGWVRDVSKLWRLVLSLSLGFAAGVYFLRSEQPPPPPLVVLVGDSSRPVLPSCWVDSLGFPRMRYLPLVVQ